jgi:peptidoglycan/xylan/chitin deacetylase (PgdA/CDA1 family)
MPLKRSILKTADALGLATLARRATAKSLRILGYHGVWVTPGHSFGDCTFIPPEQFEARMERLKGSGRPVLRLGEAVELLTAGALPEAAVVVTIDDGWASTLTHMVPVLERLGLPATLYATTWYAGRDLPVVNVAVQYLCEASGRDGLESEAETAAFEALPPSERLEALRALGRRLGVGEAWLEARQFHLMGADELAEAARRGIDVQLHTHRHIDVGRQVDDLPAEIEENRAFLAAALDGGPLDHFCYPSGTWHPRAPALLAERGVKSATLVDEGINAPGADPYALRRFLDGRRVSDAEFDAYLSGLLHFLAPLKALAGRAAPARVRAR